MPLRLRPVVALVVSLLVMPLPRALATESRPPGAVDAPLLWSGRVVDRLGAPSVAHVAAFLRPPASAIPDAGSGRPALASIPLAEAVTGRDGRFDLKADLPAVPTEYRPDGWLDVMVLAEAPDGSWSLANDSMRYLAPAGGLLPRGAWVSTAAAEDDLRELLAARIAPSPGAVQRLVAEDLSGGTERPEVLQLGEPRFKAAIAGPSSNRWVGPGDPYLGCTALGVEGHENAFRTISDIDVGPAWSHILRYKQTRTTSWDVGVEQSAGQWKAGGTASFTSDVSGGFDAEYGPFPSRFRESYQVTIVHAKVLWRCASRTSPGPFYIRTVEPESWTGGTFNQGDPVIPCNPRRRESVAGYTTGWRLAGRTSRYSASTAGFGFSGAAAVTYSAETKLGWHNYLGNARDVCGETDEPFKGADQGGRDGRTSVMKRRFRPLVVVVAAGVLLGGLGLRALLRPNGVSTGSALDDQGGGGIVQPLPPDASLSLGIVYIQNRSPDPLTLVDARLLRLDPDLELLGFAALPMGPGPYGANPPITSLEYPLPGQVALRQYAPIPPTRDNEAQAKLMFGLRVKPNGAGKAVGVELRYRQKGKVRKQVFEEQVYVCWVPAFRDGVKCPGPENPLDFFGKYDDEVKGISRYPPRSS